MSVKDVAAADSYSALVSHVDAAEQTRSDEAVGAVDSYSEPEQTVSDEHSRSDVSECGVEMYSVALHAEAAVHCLSEVLVGSDV